MANSDVSVTCIRSRLWGSNSRQTSIDQEVTKTLLHRFDALNLLDKSATQTSWKDRSHRIPTLPRSVKATINRDSGPRQIGIDIVSEGQHRSDPRTRRPQRRVSESDATALKQKTFHVGHGITHIQSSDRRQALLDEVP